MSRNADPAARALAEGRRYEVTVYLRLIDQDDDVLAVLVKREPHMVVLPRIGEGYVTAELYDVPVTYVEHDTTSGEHLIAVFLDERLGDRDAAALIDAHTSKGWSLGRDERPVSGST